MTHTPSFPIQIANDKNGRRLDDGPNALPKNGSCEEFIEPEWMY